MWHKVVLWSMVLCKKCGLDVPHGIYMHEKKCKGELKPEAPEVEDISLKSLDTEQLEKQPLRDHNSNPKSKPGIHDTIQKKKPKKISNDKIDDANQSATSPEEVIHPPESSISILWVLPVLIIVVMAAIFLWFKDEIFGEKKDE